MKYLLKSWAYRRPYTCPTTSYAQGFNQFRGIAFEVACCLCSSRTVGLKNRVVACASLEPNSLTASVLTRTKSFQPIPVETSVCTHLTPSSRTALMPYLIRSVVPRCASLHSRGKVGVGHAHDARESSAEMRPHSQRPRTCRHSAQPSIADK